MNTDNSKLNLQDPELPTMFRDAKRNHGGQTVPTDFFAQFEQKMNAVIDADQLVSEAEGSVLVPSTKQPASVFRPKRWIGIAASVIVVVALGIAWQWVQPEDKMTPKSLPEITEVTRAGLLEELENIELPDQVADEVMCAASDYEIYDMYCDL